MEAIKLRIKAEALKYRSNKESSLSRILPAHIQDAYEAGAASMIKTNPTLLAKVLLRRTAVNRENGGLITLNEKDVIDWFKNGDHLREFHETDLM